MSARHRHKKTSQWSGVPPHVVRASESQGASTQVTEATVVKHAKVAIVGSREFSNPRLVAEIMEEYRAGLELVISGGAEGADRIGAKWARKNGIETLIFKPDHKKYRHPYHHRNRLIVEAADLVVAFWNGHSTGTAYTIDYARKLGKPVRVVRV